MTNNTNENYFQELELKFYEIMKQKFLKKIQIARNKDLVIDELIEYNLINYYYCFISNPTRNQILNNFLYKYERGLSFENVITDIFENREAHKRHKIKYEDSFFEKANSFQITKYFAKFTAYQCFIDFIREEFPEKYSKHENNLNKKAIKAKQELISPIPFKRNINKITVIENNNIKLEKDTNDLIIKWTSGNSKTEFVKLIYALFNAKFINNGKGEITKIVEELAIAFNVELSKSWQSNFSKNKNYTNGGHDQLELFDKIKSAYEEYLKK